MSRKVRHEIRELHIYNAGRDTYHVGHILRDLNMKTIQPRRVFLACPLRGGNAIQQPNKSSEVGWHDTLEELIMRIDAHPRDQKELEMVAPPNQSIVTRGGRVLTLVDAKSNIARTWTGLDTAGNHVQWISVTHTWMARLLS